MTPDDMTMPRATPREPLFPCVRRQGQSEWFNRPDCGGFGLIQEQGTVTACLLNDEPVSCTGLIFLDDAPAISAHREIWGLPERCLNGHIGHNNLT